LTSSARSSSVRVVRRCSRQDTALRLTSVSFSGATAGRNLVKFCFRFLSRRAEAEAEVQATGTQRETDAGMATRGPATVSRSVRALGAAIHDLRTGRHEPDEPRGSRPDLWGAAGEIPAAYPASSSTSGVAQPLEAVASTAPTNSSRWGDQSRITTGARVRWNSIVLPPVRFQENQRADLANFFRLGQSMYLYLRDPTAQPPEASYANA